MKIEVHHLTRNPTAAWNDLSKIQKVIKVQVSPPKSSVADDKVSLELGIVLSIAGIWNKFSIDKIFRFTDLKEY